MNRREKREYLIRYLSSENGMYRDIDIPVHEAEQKQLLRALMNVRMPAEAPDEFLCIQDEYLQEEIREKGITDADSLKPLKDRLYLWQGDITTLKCGAIVNAANSGMTGCYIPCHSCIDNCIHTYAGIQLRSRCAQLMKEQGHPEETGKAKITPAYNLPCRYIIHTVGPVIYGSVTEKEKELLASCYRSCLETADANDIESIAFCCISTGEFHFPNEMAAGIAVNTVQQYIKETRSDIKVIFNVYKDIDSRIYRQLLKADQPAEE